MSNARSMRNKVNDLEALASSEDYHITKITEFWLDTENRYFWEYLNDQVIRWLDANERSGQEEVFHCMTNLISIRPSEKRKQ